jgi:hypothetical protein
MNPDRQLSTTFRVGRRYRCTMSMDASGGALKCAWEPKTPKRLSRQEMADYRRGRNMMIAEFARLTNQRVLIVE